MRIARRTWNLFLPAAGLCIFCYFLYHTVEGDHGWVAQMHLQNEVNAAQDTLTRLQKQNDALAHRVQLMRPDSVDPDLLDEQARRLDYSKPGDIVILTPQQNPAPDAPPP